jgi:hypothetical protein
VIVIDIFKAPRRKPNRRARLALRFEDWPGDDRRRWNAAFVTGDVFDETGRGAHLAPTTRASWENEYGTWLGFVGRNDSSFLDEPVDSRVTRERIIQYCQALALTNSALSIAMRLEKLRHALRLLAPEADWEWLVIITKRIRAKALPRPKGPRYQDISKLSMLGFTLMDEAKQHSAQKQSISLRSALTFRDGLIIAIEAATLRL